MCVIWGLSPIWGVRRGRLCCVAQRAVLTSFHAPPEPPNPPRQPSTEADVFRPATLALAVAVAFCGPMAGVLANPTGAQVVAGQATLSGSGNQLIVTTQNAPGTQYSAINWQSFNIPAGSSTRFVQPSASSTSINRVQSNNPSAIFGTLSSNGNLVLVNPSGITVGSGAVVDTAGFAASTLPMSNADALTGRQRFSTDATQPSGNLQVQGNIIARNGDVVLIAPNIEVARTGVVQAPNGAAILAAGQTVEVTGRGLEGIRMEVQAPSDRAVNLGTLEGDAVGIFASSLKHSGLIKATAVSAEGGRVILRAQDLVEIEGTTKAERLNRLGGLFQATADKVGLSGTASVDVSGANGGGDILIGGDYQGKNPNVRNAQMTFVGAGAQLNASATDQGDGGKVIVWSDRSTRVFGTIEAKGGANGGNGGLVETSGKQGLEFGAKVDVSSVKGISGILLLDPEFVTILGGNRPDIYIPGSTVRTTSPCPPAASVCVPTVTTTTTPGTYIPATPAPSSINFSDAAPNEIYQSDLEGFKSGTNVVIEASSWIGVAGSFSTAVTLSANSSLTLRTRNAPTDSSVVSSGIKLSDSNLGPNLEFRTQGTGSITLQTGVAGSIAQKADISVGKLTTDGGTINLTAQGKGSDVNVLGNINAGKGDSLLKAEGSVRFDSASPLLLTGSSLTITGGNGIIVNGSLTNNSGSWTNPAGSMLSINGNLNLGKGSPLVNAGTVDTASGSVVNTNNQDLINQPGGALKGTGVINVGTASVVNQGVVAPGHSPGTLSIQGNYTQTSTGSLNMEVASASTYDVLQVSGIATLGGSLVVAPGAYVPTATENYTLLRASSVIGAFSSINSAGINNGAVAYSPTGAPTQVGFTANAASPATGGTTGNTGAGTGSSTTGTGSTGSAGGGTSGATSSSGTNGSTSTTGGSSTTGNTILANSPTASLVTEMMPFGYLVTELPYSARPGNQVSLLNLGYPPAPGEFILSDGQICR